MHEYHYVSPTNLIYSNQFSKVLSHLILKIKSFSVIIFLSKDSCVYKILYFVSLPAIDV